MSLYLNRATPDASQIMAPELAALTEKQSRFKRQNAGKRSENSRAIAVLAAKGDHSQTIQQTKHNYSASNRPITVHVPGFHPCFPPVLVNNRGPGRLIWS